jgi:DNA polymerase-3 subunit gamma/tau
MQYQVLARKWRPQTFQEIVGQEHVSRTLLNALKSGRIAHAFLFSGPRGCGKTSTARILAKALNCHEDKTGEPCGKCASCTEITAGNCIDVIEIDAASNTGVDNVRQLIEQARYQPARDRHKIFIIDEVHMLSNAAFSALLKTLEEPPAHVVFIMATTEFHKIPATILSRCQQYSFRLIPFPRILEQLRMISKAEKIDISEAALEQVVFSSGGSLRDAMSALDQVVAFSGTRVKDDDVAVLLGLIEPRILSRIVKAIANNDAAAILGQVGELVEAGQDLKGFCRTLISQFRNLMVLKAGIADPALLGIPETLLPDLREQAALFSKEDLLRLFETILKIDSSMRNATQIRFLLEMGLLELAYVARMKSIEDLIAEFSSLSDDSELTQSRNTPEMDPATAPSSHVSRKEPGDPHEGRTEKKSPEKRIEQKRGNTTSSQNPRLQSMRASESGRTSRDLLHEIASHTGREALDSLMQSLDGARLKEDKVILELGSTNEFLRHQIKENLPAIVQAASAVVGKKVTVLMEEPSRPPQISAKPQNHSDSDPEADLLEKAKQEPIVQSFLDIFPGQVKAEKIDP